MNRMEDTAPIRRRSYEERVAYMQGYEAGFKRACNGIERGVTIEYLRPLIRAELEAARSATGEAHDA